MQRLSWSLLGLLWFFAEAATAFPLSLRDGRMKAVRLEVRPHRVISLTVATDEILWDVYGEAHRRRLLGLSFLAWDPKYSNIANEVAESKKLRAGEDIEALIKAKPDLIVAASFTRPEIITQLEHAGIPVFVLTNFRTLEDIRANILTIGELTGFSKEAASLADTFMKRVQQMRDRAPSKRPTLLNYDAHGVVFGSDCLFDEIVTAAGAENLGRALGVQGWQAVTAERLLTLRPDFVLLNTAESGKDLGREVKGATGWKSLAAVKKGRFIVLEGRLVNAASHYVADAIEGLHGKLFSTSH